MSIDETKPQNLTLAEVPLADGLRVMLVIDPKPLGEPAVVLVLRRAGELLCAFPMSPLVAIGIGNDLVSRGLQFLNVRAPVPTDEVELVDVRTKPPTDPLAS